MSQTVFPELPGLKWSSKRSPIFRTLVQEAVSGRETRVRLWAYPRWRWELSYEFLRSDAVHAEWQELLGFWLQRGGAYDSFLFRDPEDCSASGEVIGTGDGFTTQFRMARTLGGYTEPTPDLANFPTIYVGGEAQAYNVLVDGDGNYIVDGEGNFITDGYEPEYAWTLNTVGVLTFAAAPPQGAAVTADFEYYWRVRFGDDEADFQTLWYKFWELRKIELRSLR